MKTRLSFVQRAAAVACGIAAAPLLATAQAAPTKADWRETYAYTQGMQAFVFGFPWTFLPEIRWKWVTQDPHSPFVPYAPLNQFYNSRQLTTAEYRDGGSPNNDTLYSVAWLDLSKEPLILSVPDVGNFLLRASLQCLGDIISNDTAEAIYMNTFTDAAGATLSGAHTYKIRFAPGGAPPVGAFWSITMYGLDNNFVANRINRYKLGSLPAGSITPDADGGMTITVSHQQPAGGAANWLPAPQGDFYLVLRTYMPQGKLLDQSWEPPAVSKAS